MSSRPSVGALVLAAGQSTRLGEPKQLLPLDGRPLLARTLDMVRASSLSQRYLVLGAHADEIRARVDADGFDIIVNPDFAEGQATSLKAGIDALPDEIDAVVVVLGDQPLLPPGLLDVLADAFDPAQHIAVRPRYADCPGNPVLLARSLFPKIRALSGDTGARGILDAHASEVGEVPVESWTWPRDVDTREDYLALLEDWAALGAPDVPRYCQRCGAPVGYVRRHDRLRPICGECDFTYFHDPKIAVAVIVEIDGKVVMQQREIDPGRGKWTFPSGFVDRGEVVHAAAAREVLEEVGLEVRNLDLLDVYSRPGETVVLIVYHTRLDGQQPVAGNESAAVGLFPPHALPELAFARDAQVLEDWRRRVLPGMDQGE